MLTVITTVALFVVLCILTLLWAFSQIRTASDEPAAPGLLTARVWAASTSFVVLLVFVTGALNGLLRSDVPGLPRLVEGLSWRPVQVSLIITAVLTLVPLVLMLRAQVEKAWTRRARLEMATHLLLLGIAVGLLLSLAFGP